MLLFSVTLCTVFIIYTIKRYANIALLCEQIDKVLHNSISFEIDGYEEGELSILRSEIYKMTVRLREHAVILEKDRLFLSNAMTDISHQLRTPLTSINMIISFLKNPDLKMDKQLQLIRELEMLFWRMDWLISSLLKMSKIDAGVAIFKKETVSVHNMIAKAVEPFIIPMEVRGVSLNIQGDPCAQFEGDMNWSAEAVGNILKNCLEHTDPAGTIEINYTQNLLFTEIVIRDNGSGIIATDLPNIFERFYQGKTVKDSGFGIGLALCKMILSQQNATVKASNLDTEGACFSIRFFHHIL